MGNPCDSKGKDSCRARCECHDGFYSHVTEGPEKNARLPNLSVRFHIREKRVSLWPPESSKYADQTVILPCQGRLKLPDAELVRKFKDTLRKNTAFKGCQAVESDLLAEKLIRYTTRERVGIEQMLTCLTKEDDYESGYDGGKSGVLNPTSDMWEGLRIVENKENRTRQTYRQLFKKGDESEAYEVPGHGPIDQPWAHLMRAAPCDLRQSHLRDLKATGIFKKYGPEVEAAVYLLARNLKSENMIKDLFPVVKIRRFKRAEGIVNRVIDNTMPEKFKRLLDLYASLKKSQQETVQVVYGADSPTLKEAASRLGIKVTSLRDRLKVIEKRVRGAFPEYCDFAPVPKFRALDSDLVDDGFYRKSEARRVRPLFAVDPNTKMRVGELPIPLKSPRPAKSDAEILKIKDWAKTLLPSPKKWITVERKSAYSILAPQNLQDDHLGLQIGPVSELNIPSALEPPAS